MSLILTKINVKWNHLRIVFTNHKSFSGNTSLCLELVFSKYYLAVPTWKLFNRFECASNKLETLKKSNERILIRKISQNNPSRQLPDYFREQVQNMKCVRRLYYTQWRKMRVYNIYHCIDQCRQYSLGTSINTHIFDKSPT